MADDEDNEEPPGSRITVSRTPPEPDAEGINLTFSLYACDGCGAEREAANACPACGREPDADEMDEKRQARQAVAQLARDALHEPAPDDGVQRTAPGLGRSLLEVLLPWMKGSIPALNRATEDPGALIDYARQVVLVRSWVRNTPRFRPWMSLYDAIDGVVTEVELIFTSYLDAISADRIADATRLSEAAQGAINRAAKHAGEMTWAIEAATEVEQATDHEEALRILARITAATIGTSDILSADRAGSQLFCDIIGSATACPPGVGLWLSILATNHRLVGDPGRFEAVAKAAFSLLQQSLKGANLVSNPVWRDDMRQAAIEAVDEGRKAFMVVTAAQNDRIAVGGLVDLAHSLVEAIGSPHIAAIRYLTTKVASYERAKAADAGATVRALREKHGHLIVGLSEVLRNTKAHRDYRVVDDGIDIRDAQGIVRSHFSVVELGDIVLAGSESVTGMTVGFLCAAIVTGVPVEDLLPPADTLEWREMVGTIFEFHGWTGVEIVQSDPREVAIVGTPPLNLRSLGTAFIVANFLPATVEVMRASSADLSSGVVAPMALIRAYAQEQDDYVKNNVRFVAAMRAAELNGEQGMSIVRYRKFVAVTAQETLSDDFPARQRRLNHLRNGALDAGDRELAAALRGLMGASRAADAGTVRSKEEGRQVHRLTAFGSATVNDNWNDFA